MQQRLLYWQPEALSFCYLLLMDIAWNCYHRTGKYQKAERAYLLASDMVPNRMMANYKLWRMYLGLGNEKKSIEIAKRILSQPVKVINSFTINARTEIKTFLSDK